MPHGGFLGSVFSRLFAACAVAVLLWGLCGNSQAWAEAPSTGAADLAALARQTTEQFQPPSAKDVADARQVLREAIERLDHRLEQAGEEGKNWRGYLKWEDFETLAGDGEVPPELADRARARLTAGYEGLRLRVFADVADALWRLRTLEQLQEGEAAARQFASVAQRVPQLVEQYLHSPSAETEATLATLLRWLANFEAAEPLLAGIEQRFDHPNLLVDVSGSWLAAGLTEPVDTEQPVRELILGTDIHGTGHVTGTRTFELVPNDEAAELQLVVEGTVDSDTVGYNGPATIYSTATSPFVSRKTILVSAEAIEIRPTVSEATTTSDIHHISMRCGRQMGERIAWRRAMRQKPQADYIAARRAELRLNRQIDREFGERLSQPRENFQKRFRRALLDRDWFPKRLDFRTTDDTLHVVGKAAIAHWPAAPVDPPEPPDGDIAVRVHQSWVNNAAGVSLAGLIVNEAELLDRLAERLGKLPEELQPEEDEAPWTIFFAEHLPLGVQFEENTITVFFRGREYEKEGTRYPGMNVTVQYTIDAGDQGIRLLREAEPAVFPPGFDPEGEARLSVRQQVIRRMLQRRFDRIFPPEVAAEPQPLIGALEEAGAIQLTTCRAENGWLTLAWRRVP